MWRILLLRRDWRRTSTSGVDCARPHGIYMPMCNNIICNYSMMSPNMKMHGSLHGASTRLVARGAASSPLYIQRQRLRQLRDRALIATVNASLTWSVKPGSWRPRAWRTGALSLGLWSTWMRAVIVTTAGALVGALTPLLQPTVCAFYALLHV